MAIGKVAVLKVVNVKVTPNQEGVVVEVASTSIAIVTGTRFLDVVNVKVGVFLIVIRLVAWTSRL